MRSKPMRRKSPPATVAAGVLMIAIPSTAVALTVRPPQAPPSAIQASLSARHVAYGAQIRVAGNATAANAGRSVVLEFASAGSANWRALSSSSVRSDGSFRLAAPLQRSGLLKVVGWESPGTRSATPIAATGTGPIAPSPARAVSVTPRLQVPGRSFVVLGGSTVEVGGKLLPGVAGRRLILQSRTGGSWHTLRTARTGPRGGFQLRFTPGSLGQQQLRVRFRGDRLNTAASAAAGRVTVFTQSLASWYDDGGSTACGFHAYYGVANRDVPCGTRVSFHYGGRTVTAVVDDRGPYVGGRQWDLNQNTAGALGFGGVDTVWSSM